MHLNAQIEQIQDKMKYPLLFENRCVAYYDFFAEEFKILTCELAQKNNCELVNTKLIYALKLNNRKWKNNYLNLKSDLKRGSFVGKVVLKIKLDI